MKSFRWTFIALGVVGLLLLYIHFLERPVGEDHPQIIGLDKDAVTKVEIKMGESQLTLAKDPEGAWSMAGPAASPASKDEVNSLLGNFSPLLSESVVQDAVTEPARYGLEPAEREIRFFAGEKETAVLKIGKKTEIGSAFYAQTTGDPKLYTVATYKVDRYRPDPELFKEKPPPPPPATPPAPPAAPDTAPPPSPPPTPSSAGTEPTTDQPKPAEP